MIEEFGGHPDGTRFVADVCVIGAGPAGLALAGSLAGPSTRVLLVETGGLDPDPDTERINDGEIAGLPLPTLLDGRTRAFGGATKLWPGQCIQLDDEDLDQRDWVPASGWPLAYTDLAPFYRRAQEWFGLPEGTFDDRAWQRFGLTPPGFSPDRLVHRSSVYTPVPDTGSHQRERFAAAPYVRVLLHSSAVQVHADAGGAVNAVDLRGVDGRTATVGAATVVLAAGGIENARLLLVSGLGNAYDTVGRWFAEHPTLWVDLDVDQPDVLQRFYGRLGRRTVRYLPKIRLAPRVQREQQVLNGVADVLWELREPPGRVAARELSSALQDRRIPTGLGAADVAGAVRELGPVALAAFRRFALGRPSPAPLARARLKLLMEQAPHRDSRVTLSGERDALGVPKVRVDWRLTELDQRTAQVLTATLDGELRRLGLGRLRGLDRLAGDDWTDGVEDACHHMGTTRMSADPRHGVVDADCQVHGVPGLYLCGSSVFPTGGYANPTLTIVALALRLADHLAAAPGRDSDATTGRPVPSRAIARPGTASGGH